MFKTLQPLAKRILVPYVQLQSRCSNFVMDQQVGVVEHDIDRNEFRMILQNGEKAVLQYEQMKDGVLNLYHTELPVSCRGKGLAQLLAKAAFDHVVATDAKMILTCSYLDKYLKDNPLPQYTSRVQRVDDV